MKKYVHEYKGHGVFFSRCTVHIKEVDNTTYVGFEDMGEGTSVTNASEQIASEIVNREGLDPKKTRFFEWYPYYDGEVSEIIYTWGEDFRTLEHKARDPQWKFFCLREDNPFLI